MKLGGTSERKSLIQVYKELNVIDHKCPLITDKHTVFHLTWWVRRGYVVHHRDSTDLHVHCAPSTCVVHHQPALCTIVQKGDLIFLEEGHYLPKILGPCTMVHNAGWWCTTQVGGAQYRSMVHNIALYH